VTLPLGIAGILTLLIGVWTWRKPRQASVILWALVATLFVSAAILKLLPGNFGDNVLWYGVTMPVIWVSVQTWVYWEDKAWRAPTLLLAATAVSSAIVAFAPSPV